MTSRTVFALLALLFGCLAATAQPRLEDYLPEGTSYDPAIPTPRSVLGFEVGEWHVRHDQLVDYMRRLAAASERIEIEEQGRTHEGRPLVLLTVSSPANLARLEEIRNAHLAASEGTATVPAAGAPVIVWLGYSVHGNEASGANAALAVAYHLAAGEGEEMERLLSEAVILLDPSLNPDGLARFAQWANMHRGEHPVGDPAHREHREAWPGGRTNHYWFDLNRDWLLLQHPESRARVATFQRWRPHVVTDFHEMGSDSTYFFQPGVPSRRHPRTPEINVELTQAFARYHAAALDRAGRLYYTEETFDDFYLGKGSTYPDIQGAVGILFEQASARGHLQDTANGPLSFPFAIQNQVTTTLSTLAAAVDLKERLLTHHSDFYRQARTEAGRQTTSAWVFGNQADPAGGRRMAEILLGHGIEVYRLGRRLERDGHVSSPPGHSSCPPSSASTG